MAIAGRVMPRPRGDYNTATVYNILDIVVHNEKPWICKQNNTVNVEPSLENSESWMLLIDVDITNADTLDGYSSEHFVSKDELQAVLTTKELTFSASGWSNEAPYTQTIDWPELSDTDSPIPIFIDDGTDEASSKAKKKAFACITYFDSGNGSVTATCKYERPETDFTVGFKGVL